MKGNFVLKYFVKYEFVNVFRTKHKKSNKHFTINHTTAHLKITTGVSEAINQRRTDNHSGNHFICE